MHFDPKRYHNPIPAPRLKGVGIVFARPRRHGLVESRLGLSHHFLELLHGPLCRLAQCRAWRRLRKATQGLDDYCVVCLAICAGPCTWHQPPYRQQLASSSSWAASAMACITARRVSGESASISCMRRPGSRGSAPLLWSALQRHGMVPKRCLRRHGLAAPAQTVQGGSSSISPSLPPHPPLDDLHR